MDWSSSSAGCWLMFFSKYRELSMVCLLSVKAGIAGREIPPRSPFWFYFSFRTPLKGVPSFLTSIKRPVSLSRFTHCFVTGLKVCERAFTAPFLCPSPLGGLVAICIHPFPSWILYKVPPKGLNSQKYISFGHIHGIHFPQSLNRRIKIGIVKRPQARNI